MTSFSCFFVIFVLVKKKEQREKQKENKWTKVAPFFETNLSVEGLLPLTVVDLPHVMS